MDGECVDDVVLMNAKGNLTVARASGDGIFSFDRRWSVTGFGSKPRCSVADVDADGRSEIVCIYQGADHVPRIGIERSLPGGGFAGTETPLSAAGVTDVELKIRRGGDSYVGKHGGAATYPRSGSSAGRAASSRPCS